MRIIHVLFGGLMILMASSVALAQTDIRNAPGGKRLLFIDGDDIRAEPGGKRLLFIDGDTLRDAPGGKRLLFIDGDDIRPEPGGIRLAFIDGDDIRRAPGSKRLLFIDGDDIRPEPGGPRLLFIDGKVTRPQLVAVLYMLKPELFKLSDEETAALKKAFADQQAADEAEASKDRTSGKYECLTSRSSDGKDVSVNVIVTKKGDLYTADFNYKNGQKWGGVGMKHNDEIWFAIAPQSASALGVYTITGGSLKSEWFPGDGDKAAAGAEELSGSPDLKGAYKIVSGKAVKTGAAYAAGTVTITAAENVTVNSNPAYWLAWQIGEYKSLAVGFRVADKLVVASGAKEFQIVALKLENGQIGAGDFFSSNQTSGFYTLNRMQDEAR